MTGMFAQMIGTLAVILVVAAFIGGSDIITKFTMSNKKWAYSIATGILGGLFGIYGNISGFQLGGARVSVRDIGPMLAGFTGGPVGGIIAGLIAAVHRIFMGFKTIDAPGDTTLACAIATTLIGIICGIISLKKHRIMEKPLFALLISALMEAMHLGIVLIVTKPFSMALKTVQQIALPFISINALGFCLMIIIITYMERQRNLTIEKSRLESELEVASVIQHSLLPGISNTYPGRKEVELDGYMKTAKEVGGDFYDLFFVRPTKIAFVIGDVSGKGVPAALFMASSKIILQNCVRDIKDLEEAVKIANNAICDRNEADMFITIWVGVLDLESGELNYVSAGHNAPVLSRNGHAEFLQQKNNFVMAGMQGVEYKQQNIQLENNDVIYLYTDGVTEAEDKKHNLFGDDRLLNCFRNDISDPTELIGGVRKAINEFINGNSQFDDITMLCFKWKKQ
ncbi:MAG: SpoIIE family protein phosphatase [Eubacterium sp.]|nr:SpoIIE family protein phosphatase [Eubacterium sp.]